MSCIDFPPRAVGTLYYFNRSTRGFERVHARRRAVNILLVRIQFDFMRIF